MNQNFAKVVRLNTTPSGMKRSATIAVKSSRCAGSGIANRNFAKAAKPSATRSGTKKSAKSVANHSGFAQIGNTSRASVITVSRNTEQKMSRAFSAASHFASQRIFSSNVRNVVGICRRGAKNVSTMPCCSRVRLEHSETSSRLRLRPRLKNAVSCLPTKWRLSEAGKQEKSWLK